MTDITPLDPRYWELSETQLMALPHAELQRYDGELNTLVAWAKQARDRLNAALERRYGEQARAARLEAGKDFGVIHLTDGPLRVTADQPKRVTWDQAQLTAIAQRITASGERPADFLDIEYSVSESRFNNWPPTLRVQFEGARTVKPGKPSFRLALIGEV